MAHALAQLGMNSGANPRNTQSVSAANEDQAWPESENGKDYYVSRNGVKYAGTHLLIDLWGATNLDDIELVEEALRRSAIEGGATILHCHLHHFQPNGGISGVLVLAESHISIHSWPERGYAALDVFMCGDCDPYKAIPVLKDAFKPDFVTLSESKRGLMP
ncbi:MAG TPA: adenosylmethionine decarboxylase [Candidatus Omnitrophota bacterium]|nr:adenosylmethionine decarboxylase [Candidatus Omnitrophota bacterium]